MFIFLFLDKTEVILSDIINIKTVPCSITAANLSGSNFTLLKSFTLTYAQRCNRKHFKHQQIDRSNKWRIHKKNFSNADPRIIRNWYETISNVLAQLVIRPKTLLLFVNPFGGKRQAHEIYEKYAKPLFIMANIDVSVVVSQRANQISDILCKQTLDYDGIVCVGGDGTFSEVFNGLIMRRIKELGKQHYLYCNLCYCITIRVNKILSSFKNLITFLFKIYILMLYLVFVHIFFNQSKN